uniref:Isoleucine--tRNA ligase, cytoplasmic n=1 Tax=Plectus sambesii TaxID=2011161 RepID=A0A914VF94_9BILA
MAQPLETVAESISFTNEEAKTLEFWRAENVFQTSLQLSKGRPRYSFYDGPPFATGLPHYGHILAGTIKDIVTRWAHQNGYFVDRRFGWDTHGLPVEYEVDKALGIKGPKDVEAMGIDKYNAQCRSIVMRHAHEWEETVERMGRWIDFKRDYKTMYPWFMESVWWVFHQLFTKGLVYRGVKVMPFSTGCSTPLSNFEAGQNYKDVVDPAVMVSFVLDDSKEMLVAWTTTPWTLPSNLAVAVHPDLDYVTVEDGETGNHYILMELRLHEVYKKGDEYKVLRKFKGIELKDKTYQPLFPYFAHLKQQIGAFRVLTGTFVTTDQGTGVVHEAPYFGEIDYQTCLEHGLITKDMKIVCPVDEVGCFTDEVVDFKGIYVKDADKLIIKKLKADGRLVRQGTTTHSYPFCWRSDTPLLYKAVPSWFIRVEVLVPKLLANNEQTYWVPSFVQEKRFANWLRDARDWAVSRNRFWGTPINMWVSDDLEEIVCVRSIAELEELTGTKITDLHRESVDHLTIPSKTGRGVLKRVSEVFDCWFESGSMPYAQVHYPFENRKDFEDNFPADFIAEGIDQTRGWFYTLLVLSTALFDKPPFKNLICNGLVLAGDGEKMSKRKKNYPDPMEIVNKYGADALRLYLINSPVVRGDNLKFREDGVKDVVKDVLLPWFNAYRFLVQNVQRWEQASGRRFTVKLQKSSNVMDQWILSFTNSLVGFVRKEMAAYHLYAVVPPLVKYFETLTNWYVRMNRKRIKGDSGEEECVASLETLYNVLLVVVRLMAPFTPFLTEMMWRNLRHLLDPAGDVKPEASVHYVMIPDANTALIDEAVERRVRALQSVVEIVRVMRDRKGLPMKYPLSEVVVIQRDTQFLDDVKSLEPYLLDEVNVRKLTLSDEKEKWGVKLKAEPNFRALGARLKGDQKKVADYLKNKVSDAELAEFLSAGKMVVLGHELGSDDLAVAYAVDSDRLGEKYEAHSDNQTVVLLDASANDAMQEEGLMREIVNRVQKMRKKAKLATSDNAVVFCQIEPSGCSLHRVAHDQQAAIENATKTPLRLDVQPAAGDNVLLKESSSVKDAQIHLAIVDLRTGAPPATNGMANGVNTSVANTIATLVNTPAEGSVTVYLVNEDGSKKTVQVAPKGAQPLNYSGLLHETRNLFGLWQVGSVRLSFDKDGADKLTPKTDLLSLDKKQLFVHRR